MVNRYVKNLISTQPVLFGSLSQQHVCLQQGFNVDDINTFRKNTWIVSKGMQNYS